MLNIGLIGLGTMSVRHYDAFKKLPDAKITAICTASEENLRKKAEQYGISKCYTDYRELLKQPDIDAVVVVVPNYLHKEICIASLEAGKHVLCEKPPAINAADAELMEQCAERNKRLLMYGFMFRFSPKYQMAKDISTGGRIGDIYLIRASSLQRCGFPGGWFSRKSLSGGGPLIDRGVHMLDLIMYLMGEPKPVRVYAKTFKRCKDLENVKAWNRYSSSSRNNFINDVEEMAVAMISFDNGSELVFEISVAAHIKRDCKYIEVLGSNGGLEIEPEMELHTAKDGCLWDEKPIVGIDKFDYQGAIDNQDKHFIDCIKNRADCIAPAECGTSVMKLIDALYKSAETNMTVEI